MVLVGDLGPFQEMFLPEQPWAFQFPFHDLGQPRQSSLRGLLYAPNFRGSSGWDLAQGRPSLRWNVSKFQVLPRVGKNRAHCCLLSLEACTG